VQRRKRNAADLELIGRCVASRPHAWGEFVDRFGPSILALARRYLRLHGRFPDQAELEDVVQEVFLALTRKNFKLLRNYDPTFTVKTYLGIITRTQVHRILRKQRPATAGLEALEQAPAPGGEVPAAAARSEELELLARAIERLPPKDAAILRLRFLRELDYQAIAEAMKIPEPSVGQTLFRAKKRLLEKLRSILSILV